MRAKLFLPVIEALFRKPMSDAVFLLRQPTGLAFLNYRRPLDLPVFIPNGKNVSNLITPFFSFSNS
ncbi:MAG: hypothetical protein OGM67_14230 [Oscillospiraceae bacterium]|nr:MAG: hypothetical protein OGM67_14230 [Oscillospiraceae bacterium]